VQIDKRYKSLTVGLIGVFVLFAVLVPVYFAVSRGLPDGLDKQLEENHVQEKEPVYNPPFSQLINYGSDIPSYIVNGLIGGMVVLIVGVFLTLILKAVAITTKSIKTVSKSELNAQLTRKR
jgi:ABC-type cobalt transport system substrate-binding protein